MLIDFLKSLSQCCSHWPVREFGFILSGLNRAQLLFIASCDLRLSRRLPHLPHGAACCVWHAYYVLMWLLLLLRLRLRLRLRLLSAILVLQCALCVFFIYYRVHFILLFKN